mgnify:FL=1
MKVYIASYFNTRDRIVPMAHAIRDQGHTITASWLETANDDNSRPRWREYALRDMDEILASDLLIVDTFDVTPRGGREVELGLAIAWGLYVWGVGPKRNVFHELVDPWFETWEEALTDLGNMDENTTG